MCAICFYQIGLEIVDDNQWEPDEEFFVKLTLIPQESENVRLGRTSIMEITILNDDGMQQQILTNYQPNYRSILRCAACNRVQPTSV